MQIILPIFHMDYSESGTFGVLFNEYAMFYTKILFSLVITLLDMFPTQDVWRYLPQWDQ